MNPTPTHRAQFGPEEWVNALTHGIGFVGALAVLPLLIAAFGPGNDPLTLAGAMVFNLTILLLYASSTLYHIVPESWPGLKRFFQRMDHAAIYLLIAGSYTPFVFGVLRESLGWTLFGIIWGLAFLGIVLKSLNLMKTERVSVGFYLVMGWLMVIGFVPLIERLPVASWVCLIAGGLAYTAGIVFYLADHKPYAHGIWHCFVLVGTACHVASVLTMLKALG